MKCFGAVGFKNNANDSKTQIREIKKKFRDDLKVALSADKQLRAFVFFTNIALPPSDHEYLSAHARKNGITFVDILDRERLRILLDSAPGYAIRLSFLDIPLSDAEQKDFFSRFGREIQDVILGRLDSVEQRMEEILFRNWRRGRCRSISVRVKLKSLFRPTIESQEPYRFCARLTQPMTDGNGEILLGCYSVIDSTGPRVDYERHSFLYSKTKFIADGKECFQPYRQGTRALYQPFKEILFGTSFGKMGSAIPEYGIDVDDLETFCIDFYCDSAWLDKVDVVEVWYDDFLASKFVAILERTQCLSETSVIPYWPEQVAAARDRPCQHWGGFSNWEFANSVPKRQRLGEN